MQLSLHADYACRVLIYLAAIEEEKASIEEIAQAYGISQNHLVKVVHKLGKIGFIKTMRGRGGGICLAKPADQIDIGQVIRLTEPNFHIVECFEGATNTCPITGACGLKTWLFKAKENFLQTLDGVMLSEVSSKKQDLCRVLGGEVRCPT